MTVGSTDWFRQLTLGSLPTGWFSDGEIVRAVANATAQPASMVFDQLTYVSRQTRLATASDAFLDILAEDWFGRGVMMRRKNEADDAYRDRLQAEVLRPLGTRPALIDAVHDLTGTEPRVFEPMNAGDCGAWNTGLMGWNIAGRIGSRNMPFQFFVEITRPNGQGIPDVGGYAANGSGTIGGYGIGAIKYSTADDVTGDVTDEDIYATVARTLPAGVTAWVKIKSGV